MARPSRPAPPPLQVDTARVVLAGTVLWALALVVLLLLGDRVDRSWIWTCVVGIVLAGLGIALMRWQGQLKDPSAPHRERTPSPSPLAGSSRASGRGRGGTLRRGRSRSVD